MADLVSPQATRLTLPRWLDARVAVGLLLVLVSVVAGARLVAAAGHLTPVYVAAHDLTPGQRVADGDLTVAHVRLGGDAGRYVAAGAVAPVGYVVTRFVGARELVPVGALATGAAVADTRFVTVPVQPGHLPGDLAHGDLVDVYLTAKISGGAAVPMPALVLSGVPVESREGGSRSFGGETALAVVLDVPADHVAAMVHAIESGTLDLVRVPPEAAQRLAGSASPAPSP